MSDVTHILESVVCVIGNIVYEKTGLRPLENSADRFENDTFKMHAYDWGDETQPWNFKCGDIEVTWYKYFGRGMTANKEVWGKEALKMMDDCLRSLE